MAIDSQRAVVKWELTDKGVTLTGDVHGLLKVSVFDHLFDLLGRKLQDSGSLPSTDETDVFSAAGFRSSSYKKPWSSHHSRAIFR